MPAALSFTRWAASSPDGTRHAPPDNDARIDPDLSRALTALRVLRQRADDDLTEPQNGTAEPERRPVAAGVTRPSARTPEPEPAPLTPSGTTPRTCTAEPDITPAPLPRALNRQHRRRLETLARQVQRRAA